MSQSQHDHAAFDRFPGLVRDLTAEFGSDGIGAIVSVTADGVTRSRLQDGGQHNRCQNHARLHFGLGRAATIDKISVQWPSGTVQQLSGVAADRLVRIKEVSAP